MMDMNKEIILKQICLLAQKRAELANGLAVPNNEELASLYRKLDACFVEIILAESSQLVTDR